MGAVTETLTAGKGVVDSRCDDFLLRQTPGQGSNESDWAEASCAFCRGTGMDPFGIMSWLSTCCVCKGGGIVQVRGPQARCAHCRGSGAVKRLTCTACGGKGLGLHSVHMCALYAFPSPSLTFLNRNSANWYTRRCADRLARSFLLMDIVYSLFNPY